MSDSVQVAAVPPSIEPMVTALSAILHGNDPAISLILHAGCQTPQAFSDSSTELSALLYQTAVYDLGYRTHIDVSGPDSLRWLNGMVSNAVQSLPENQGNYSLILNAQGRVL